MTRTVAELRASTTFRGTRVSLAHRIALEAADAADVRFQINSGRRTREDQERLIREKGVYDRRSNPHGAARYSASAPHIKRTAPGGKYAANHALDIDLWVGGGPRAVARFYAKHGCPLVFNVVTENWHVDPLDEAKLIAAARKLDDPLREYPVDERRWIRELDVLDRDLRERVDKRKVERRLVLLRVMTSRRKSIWHAAQRSGWKILNRTARYKSLLSRTK